MVGIYVGVEKDMEDDWKVCPFRSLLMVSPFNPDLELYDAPTVIPGVLVLFPSAAASQENPTLGDISTPDCELKFIPRLPVSVPLSAAPAEIEGVMPRVRPGPL